MEASLESIIRTSFEQVTGDQLRDGTEFIGEAGVLDSLSLVRLILDVEDRIKNELDISVSLMNDKAFSAKGSPFRNIATLTQYILSL